MICYLDSNALVKLFVEEPGSLEVSQAVRKADLVGTALISRAKVVATFGKALRLGVLSLTDARAARHRFSIEWRHYLQIRISDSLVDWASDLSWGYQLRGYDAVQLAAAMAWQESLGVTVSMVTFDVRLWEASRQAGLDAYPGDLLKLKESWQS